MLSYVVWDDVTGEDMGLDHVPIALWSSTIALFGMVGIYAVLRVCDRILQQRDHSAHKLVE
jgi:hypothetical protein